MTPDDLNPYRPSAQPVEPTPMPGARRCFGCRIYFWSHIAVTCFMVVDSLLPTIQPRPLPFWSLGIDLWVVASILLFLSVRREKHGVWMGLADFALYGVQRLALYYAMQ